MDDVFTPLWNPKEPGPRFKPSEAAAIIMEPGMVTEKVAHEVRAMLREAYVQTREQVGKGTKNPHSVLSMSDVATAKVLSILKWDHSVTDPGMYRAVSAACYGWQEGDRTPETDRFYHPIFNAIRDAARDKWWAFRMDTYRNENGMLLRSTALYDLDYPPAARFPDDAIPRGTFTLNLRPHLEIIAAAAQRKLQAN